MSASIGGLIPLAYFIKPNDRLLRYSLTPIKFAAIISVLRSMVFELLAFLILPLILGINGIWCAVAVAEMAAFFVITLKYIINLTYVSNDDKL